MGFVVRGLWLASFICLAANTPARGEWSVTPSVSVNETFTDNVDLDPDGEDKDALVTEVTPGFQIRSQLSRVNAALNAALTVRHQTAGDDKGVNLDTNLAGFATVEVSKELFFIDAAASISREVLNAQEGDAASNRNTVQIYAFSPYLRNQFGDFASAETKYTLTEVLAGSDNVSNTTANEVRLTLDSGNDFSELLWSFVAAASDAHRTSDNDVTRAEAQQLFEYVVTPSISLLTGVGYQKFDDGQTEFDDITWQAGFRLRPGARTELRATYGRRDNDESLAADFRFDLGPRTTFTASYEERLETSQETLARNLGFIATDSTGNLIDSQSGQAFGLSRRSVNIDNETRRINVLRSGLLGERGRNNFGLNVTMQNDETVETGEKVDLISVAGRFGRQLNRRLSLNAFVGYRNRDSKSENQEDDEYAFVGGLSYNLSENLSANLSYRYQMQDSTDATNEYTENAVTVGVRARF